MPRKAIPCAACGQPMQPGSTSAPAGEAKHNRCRVSHGSAGYRRGCRCHECKAANAAANRRFRRIHRERTGENYRNRFARDGISPALRLDVYVRDEFRCQICREPVDMKLNGQSDPMGATLDHITPRSLGGPDTAENLQLAHRRCNSEKGLAETAA